MTSHLPSFHDKSPRGWAVMAKTWAQNKFSGQRQFLGSHNEMGITFSEVPQFDCNLLHWLDRHLKMLVVHVRTAFYCTATCAE